MAAELHENLCLSYSVVFYFIDLYVIYCLSITIERTLNQLVGGSNPPRPTNKFKGLREPFVFLEIPEEKIRSKTQPKVLLLNF